MPSPINKETLEYLAELARLKLDPKEEKKLLKDLGAILGRVEELKAIDTADIPPMAGGTDLKNIFREDAERENTNQGKGTDAFPEKEDGYLKVPPVFG